MTTDLPVFMMSGQENCIKSGLDYRKKERARLNQIESYLTTCYYFLFKFKRERES